MTNSIFHSCRMILCAISAIAVAPAWAADTATPTPVVITSAPSADQAVAPVPPTTGTAPAKLPYGADDVLKLSRAQVNEDVIVNYVQNSGTIYTLDPKDIMYLKNEGVSDRVITAMLDQRARASEAAAQAAGPAVPAGTPQPAYGTPDYAAAAPTYVQAPAAEVQPAPSTLYVIPYPQATAAYYGYPYYYPYSGYYGGGYPYYGGYCGSSLITIHAGFGRGFHGGGHFGGRFGGHSGGFHVRGRR